MLFCNRSWLKMCTLKSEKSSLRRIYIIIYKIQTNLASRRTSRQISWYYNVRVQRNFDLKFETRVSNKIMQLLWLIIIYTAIVTTVWKVWGRFWFSRAFRDRIPSSLCGSKWIGESSGAISMIIRHTFHQGITEIRTWDVTQI